LAACRQRDVSFSEAVLCGIFTAPGDGLVDFKAVFDILQSKFVKRSVPLKALTYGAIEPAAGSTVRQVIKLQNGIDKENAKLITKMIKDTKLKVQAQIMDDQVRVSGKSKDDLQSVMAMLRQGDLKFAVQFTNYR
jgi:uncharacterized protein YajQ (UPF0234 family)